VRGLRPRALQDATLQDALDQLLKQMTPGTGVQAALAVAGQQRPLPPEWEEDVLRISQEALTNTLKYAGASRFEGRLEFAPSELRLSFLDNGCGFDPQAATDGFGLTGIKERVERMGGELTIHSAPGKGTHIRITLPDTARTKERVI
jgi:signal transduction histidine kinase